MRANGTIACVPKFVIGRRNFEAAARVPSTIDVVKIGWFCPDGSELPATVVAGAGEIGDQTSFGSTRKAAITSARLTASTTRIGRSRNPWRASVSLTSGRPDRPMRMTDPWFWLPKGNARGGKGFRTASKVLDFQENEPQRRQGREAGVKQWMDASRA